ncbi:MAG: hypothetical protein FJW40_20340 [Acidobacteria bacterium]|nr:hypothetical protein [Acidobacteriota bacterium]
MLGGRRLLLDDRRMVAGSLMMTAAYLTLDGFLGLLLPAPEFAPLKSYLGSSPEGAYISSFVSFVVGSVSRLVPFIKACVTGLCGYLVIRGVKWSMLIAGFWSASLLGTEPFGVQLLLGLLLCQIGLASLPQLRAFSQVPKSVPIASSIAIILLLASPELARLRARYHRRNYTMVREVSYPGNQVLTQTQVAMRQLRGLHGRRGARQPIVSDPRLLAAADPDLPQSSIPAEACTLELRASGVVTTQGMLRAEAAETNVDLRRSVDRALGKWRFAPGTTDGKANETSVLIRFKFDFCAGTNQADGRVTFP